MASSVQWGAELLPLPALHTLAAGAYAAAWLLYADLHAKNLPSFKHVFVGFGVVLAATAAAGHFIIGNSTGTAAALLGAAVAVVAFTRQHTAIVIMSTIVACCAATMLVSDEFSLHSAHGRGLVVLILGYIFSRRGKLKFRRSSACRAALSHNSVTEATAFLGHGIMAFTFTAGGVIAGSFVALGGRVDIGVMAALLLLVMLHGTSDAKDCAAPSGGKVALVAVPGIMLTGSAFILNGDAVLALACGLALVLSFILKFFADTPCVLGSWAHHERRAQHILLLTVALAFMDVGLQLEPLVVAQLVAFAVGFALAVALVCLLLLGVEVWNPYTAAQHRMYALDLAVVASMLCTGFTVASLTSADVSAAVNWLADTPIAQHRPAAAQSMLETSFFGIVRPTAVLSGAAVCLFVLAARTMQIVQRAVPGVAPFLVHMSHRGCISHNAVALTFNGLPKTSSALAALLGVLAEFGARATFFVTAQQASEGLDALEALVEAGHEIGVLGSNRATNSTEAVNAMNAAYDLVLAVTGKAPVWFRPSAGTRDMAVLRHANHKGMAVALWSVYPADWSATSGQIFEAVKQQVRLGGEVIALHAGEPKHINPMPTAKMPLFDAVAAAESTLKALSPDMAVKTMSALCPNHGLGNEVW